MLLRLSSGLVLPDVGQSERQQITDEQRRGGGGGVDVPVCLFGPELKKK